MAPEQFRGEGADVSTEVFSYGVTCYRLLAGVHPFEGTDFGALMYNIAHGRPRPIRALEPDLPEALERALMRMLANQRDSRYQNFQEVQFDLEPLIRERRRARANALVSMANTLMASADWKGAKETLRQASEADLGNPEVRELQVEVLRRIRSEAVRPRVEELMADGRRELAARDVSRAAEAVEAALRLDSNHPELAALKKQIETFQAAAARAGYLTQAARSAMEIGDLERAEEIVTQALKEDPGHVASLELQARVAHELRSRERGKRLKRALSQVRKLLLFENLEEARAELEALRADDYDSSEIVELLTRVERETAAKKQAVRLRKGKDEARRLIKAQDYQKAGFVLAGLVLDFPNEFDLREMSDYVQHELQSLNEAQVVREAREEGQRCLDREDFDAALGAIRVATVHYPQSQELFHLEQRILRLQSARSRQGEMAEVLRQANDLLEASQFEKCLSLIKGFTDAQGEEPVLSGILRKAEEGLAQERQSARVRSTIGRARSLIEDRKPGLAIRILREASAQFPDNAELAEMMAIALRKARENEISGWVAESESLASAGQFDKALALLETRISSDSDSEDLTRCRERIFDARSRRNPAADSDLSIETTLAGASDGGSIDEPFRWAQVPQGRWASLWISAKNRIGSASALGVGLALVTAALTLHFWPGPTEPASSTVVVDTFEPETVVRIGKQTCISPDCRFILPSGRYQIEFQLKSGQKFTETITVDAAVKNSRVKLNPPKPRQEAATAAPIEALGTIVLQTKPVSTIFVDGFQRGKSDQRGTFTLPLAPGGHQIRSELPPYQPVQRNVNIVAGRRLAINLDSSVPASGVSESLRRDSIVVEPDARPTASASAPVVQPSEKAPAELQTELKQPIRLRVGTAVMAARLVRGPKPTYPGQGRQGRALASVTLAAVIGTDGTVRELKPLRGDSLLVPLAMEAVKQWLYQPTFYENEPREVATEIEVGFLENTPEAPSPAYRGPATGSITWDGDPLRTGELLVFTAGRANRGQTVSTMPAVALTIKEVRPYYVKVVEAPNEANKWSVLKLINPGVPTPTVWISWEIKR